MEYTFALEHKRLTFYSYPHTLNISGRPPYLRGPSLFWRRLVVANVRRVTSPERTTNLRRMTFLEECRSYLHRGRSLQSRKRAPSVITKLPAFYGTWRFITVLTAHHLTILSQMNPAYALPSYFFKIHCNQHPGLQSGLFPWGSLIKLSIALLPHSCHMPHPHPRWFDHSNKSSFLHLL